MYPTSMERREGPLPLPSLTALRAFEAAARHGSFTEAASELHITQTAVSHHVRALEDELGVPLFVRHTRRVELTPPGRAWAGALGDVFTRLYSANRRLRALPRARPVVKVTAIPSFASRWFVPRLGRFLERHPNVDVHVSPAAELVDFANEDVDFGIRYGRGTYRGLRVEPLYEDAWAVVCAPTLRGRTRLSSPTDLPRFVILVDDDEDALRDWLDAHGMRNVHPERVVTLTDSSMVIEAATRGQGVALARLSLAADELVAGRLVLAFPRIPLAPTGRRYALVSRARKTEAAHCAAFRAFIHEQIADLRAFDRRRTSSAHGAS
jgi:LysR family transcriptional regulator, glycine cleavage system transcriptional activator